MRIESSEEVRKREPSLPAVEEVRDREQRRGNRAHRRWRKWETESRGEGAELTGGGGSERQRAEERELSSPAVEEVRDREQRRGNRAHRRWRKWETESRGEGAELTGGGGSERQRAEERESVCREDENRVEWLRSFSFQPKRHRFGFAPYRTRTGTDPTRTKTVPENFFFGPKTGTPGVRMQRYPGSIRTHEVPGTGTAGFLPYRCFLAQYWNSISIFWFCTETGDNVLLSWALRN
jgi:hypothetical protein